MFHKINLKTKVIKPSYFLDPFFVPFPSHKILSLLRKTLFVEQCISLIISQGNKQEILIEMGHPEKAENKLQFKACLPFLDHAPILMSNLLNVNWFERT